MYIWKRYRVGARGGSVLLVALGCLAVAAVGCGSDSDGSGSGGGGGSSGCGSGSGGSTSNPQCASCLETNCGTQATDCLGPGWKTGTPGGKCQSLYECQAGCKCDDQCELNCFNSTSADCQTCLVDMGQCVKASCDTEC